MSHRPDAVERMRARALPWSRSSAIARARTSAAATAIGKRMPEPAVLPTSGGSSSSQASASSFVDTSSPDGAKSMSPGPRSVVGWAAGTCRAWSRTASPSGSDTLAISPTSSRSNGGRPASR
jgi:hypothetical protein